MSFGQISAMYDSKYSMYDDKHMNELSAQLEAEVMSKVEKVMLERHKMRLSDSVFWSKKLRDFTDLENKLKESRKEVRTLKETLAKGDDVAERYSDFKLKIFDLVNPSALDDGLIPEGALCDKKLLDAIKDEGDSNSSFCAAFNKLKLENENETDELKNEIKGLRGGETILLEKIKTLEELYYSEIKISKILKDRWVEEIETVKKLRAELANLK